MNPENEIDRQLLICYAEGTYSRREFRQLLHWFSDRRLHGKLRAAMEIHWNQQETSSAGDNKHDRRYQQLKKRLE